jgi:choice-of-anchor C domain-containing protein
MLKSKFAIAVLAFAGAVGSSHAVTNILVNGNFELNNGDVNNGGNPAYTVVNAGSSLITGWAVGGTSVDLIKDGYGAITNVSVDLAGSPGPGSLTQTFNTTAGYTYTLTWDYGNNCGTCNIDVKFGDLALQSFSVPGTGYSSGSLNFVAAGTGLSSVVFSSSSANNSGPTLDNVVLTAVPEPTAYAMALASLALLGGVAAKRRKD